MWSNETWILSKFRKWCGRKLKHTSSITKHFMIGPSFCTHVPGTFPLWRVCFATCFQEPLRGTPWTYPGLSWGTYGPMFCTFWKNSGTVLLQMSNIPEQHFVTSWTHGTNHGFNNNKRILNRHILKINPHKSSFTFVLSQFHASAKLKYHRRNTRRDSNFTYIVFFSNK